MIMRRIRKRTVRNSLGPTVIGRIITLDKQDFVGLLRILKVPSVIRVGLDRPCLVDAIRIDACGRNKVAFGYGMGVGNAEWISEDGLDWSPNLRWWRLVEWIFFFDGKKEKKKRRVLYLH